MTVNPSLFSAARSLSKHHTKPETVRRHQMDRTLARFDANRTSFRIQERITLFTAACAFSGLIANRNVGRGPDNPTAVRTFRVHYHGNRFQIKRTICRIHQ